VYINEVGDRYEGDFLEGKKHGFGSEMFCNGDLYIGSYQNGKPQGEGKYQWHNKNVYEGKLS
jgi:hypothetical protein